MPDGPWPATGSLLAAVETAASATATVAGKPGAPIFETARSLLPSCRHVAVVGDRLDSDIEGGRRAGLTTILVLSGTTKRADIRAVQVEPNAVVDDLAELASGA
jgi:glycerol-1-phosphatase